MLKYYIIYTTAAGVMGCVTAVTELILSRLIGDGNHNENTEDNIVTYKSLSELLIRISCTQLKVATSKDNVPAIENEAIFNIFGNPSIMLYTNT